MISAAEVYQFISTFPEEEVCAKVFRKYVDNSKYGRIYLHPTDPRFGCGADRTLYSFRRPMGHHRKENRAAGVDYSNPRLLKGHLNRIGVTMITLSSYNKVKKDDFIDQILS